MINREWAEINGINWDKLPRGAACGEIDGIGRWRRENEKVRRTWGGEALKMKNRRAPSKTEAQRLTGRLNG